MKAFAPSGLVFGSPLPHGLRRGLYPCAAPRLVASAEAGSVSVTLFPALTRWANEFRRCAAVSGSRARAPAPHRLCENPLRRHRLCRRTRGPSTAFGFASLRSG